MGAGRADTGTGPPDDDPTLIATGDDSEVTFAYHGEIEGCGVGNAYGQDNGKP